MLRRFGWFYYALGLGRMFGRKKDGDGRDPEHHPKEAPHVAE